MVGEDWGCSGEGEVVNRVMREDVLWELGWCDGIGEGDVGIFLKFSVEVWVKEVSDNGNRYK